MNVSIWLSRLICPVHLLVFPQNGSYVLPILWVGHPLKLVCPMQTPVPSLSPSVFCSSYGMAVQIDGQQPDALTMRVIGVFQAINSDLSNVLYYVLQMKPRSWSTKCIYFCLEDFKNQIINIFHSYSELELQFYKY